MSKRATFLPFCQPSLGPEEIEAVTDVLRSGWITTGSVTEKFEANFSKLVNASSALALNSCTAAMAVALSAVDIGPGDEVIVPAMTFASTVNVVLHRGATPVIVDVDPMTLNIDPESAAKAISPATKAIIPVHFAGHACDLDAVIKLAKSDDLFILQDAAHALGTSYNGKAIGSDDLPAAFSFYTTKNITTAEGGMLTGPPELLEKARIWSLHGMSKTGHKRYEKEGSWDYDIIYPGFKYNMPDILAALGQSQLSKLDGFQKKRGEIVAQYLAAFAELPELELPQELDYCQHSWHLFVIKLNLEMLNISRAEFVHQMTELNIGTSVHFKPLHRHTAFQNLAKVDLSVAEEQYPRLVSLPLHPSLSDADVKDVIEAVEKIITGGRK